MPLNNPPFLITNVLRRAESLGRITEDNPLFTAAGRCGQCLTYFNDQTSAFAPRPFSQFPCYSQPWCRVWSFHWKYQIGGTVELHPRESSISNVVAGILQVDFVLDEPTELGLHVELLKPATFSLTGPSHSRTVTETSDQNWQNLIYDAGSYRISLQDSITGPAEPVIGHFFCIFPQNFTCDCDEEDEP